MLTQKKLPKLTLILFLFQILVACNEPATMPLNPSISEPIRITPQPIQVNTVMPSSTKFAPTPTGTLTATFMPTQDILSTSDAGSNVIEQETTVAVFTPVLPTATLPTITHTQSLTSSTYLSGTIRLFSDFQNLDLAEAFLDLDTGQIVNSFESDIQFIISRGGDGMYFTVLRPVNDSKAKPMGDSEPGLDRCKNNIFTFTSGAIPELEVGNYICVHTNQNSIVQLRVEDMDIREDWIEISFITWKPR